MTELQEHLDQALELAKKEKGGEIACYIPELAAIDNNLTHVAVHSIDGTYTEAGNLKEDQVVTLQSASKLVALIGLLEEFGSDDVFSWVRVEPSGTDFASIARLDQFGPIPSNPMLNSGAIALCSHIPGDTTEEHLSWLEKWTTKLFAKKLYVNQKVFASERRTGHRNRSIAYLLKSNGQIKGKINDILETYFFLCSFEISIKQASYLPMLLANNGQDEKGKQIISEKTTRQVVSIMATCGLYNESGKHLVNTGMPAKSSVSGLILAVALGRAGIATFSPNVNSKGTSVRGEMMLTYLSKEMGWHFATRN